MNQKGEVQAVAAVNEKIEGFFRLCRARRLTRRQGVVIPLANCGDLMLERDVVEAVAKERFHVYPVATLDDAIERFSDLPARAVFERVGATLQRFRTLAG